MKGFGSKRPGSPRAVVTYGLWGLTAAVVVALLLSAGEVAPWHGFLLAVPFMAATAWFGWTVAAFLVPIVLLLVWAAGCGTPSPPEIV